MAVGLMNCNCRVGSSTGGPGIYWAVSDGHPRSDLETFSYRVQIKRYRAFLDPLKPDMESAIFVGKAVLFRFQLALSSWPERTV